MLPSADAVQYAMRLMKEHPKEPRFFFYVAVSMALQAPPDAKGHILLMLAERWMDKARTEKRLTTLEGSCMRLPRHAGARLR